MPKARPRTDNTSTTSTGGNSPSKHVLYKTGDADAPECIMDGHGEVVLGLCRICGKAENELSGACVQLPGKFAQRSAAAKAAVREMLDGEPHEPKDLPPVHLQIVTNPTLSERIVAVPRQHDNDNPLWLGPCGEEWNAGVTQSMIGRFLMCRERFRLKYVLGLEPPDKWHHTFGYGNMWHCCEQMLAEFTQDEKGLRAKYATWEEALHKHCRELMDRYPLQRDDIVKWGSVCAVQFPEYVKYWSQHPDVQSRTPLLQEQVFDVPYRLPSGRVVRLRGKWDSVDFIPAHTDDQGQEWPDGIWLQENKTKGDIDRVQVERQLKFDLQTMLYLISLDTYKVKQGNMYEVLRDAGALDDPSNDPVPILGVRYNVVRRPLSGGKGNISPHKAKATKTKYTPAETAEHFYERLRADYIAKEPDYWFFRVRAGISARDIDVFCKTCLDPILEQMCVWYGQVTAQKQWVNSNQPPYLPMNWRHPFGVYNPLDEGGATEYDAMLETGCEVGLRRTSELFTELK